MYGNDPSSRARAHTITLIIMGSRRYREPYRSSDLSSQLSQMERRMLNDDRYADSPYLWWFSKKCPPPRRLCCSRCSIIGTGSVVSVWSTWCRIASRRRPPPCVTMWSERRHGDCLNDRETVSPRKIVRSFVTRGSHLRARVSAMFRDADHVAERHRASPTAADLDRVSCVATRRNTWSANTFRSDTFEIRSLQNSTGTRVTVLILEFSVCRLFPLFLVVSLITWTTWLMRSSRHALCASCFIASLDIYKSAFESDHSFVLISWISSAIGIIKTFNKEIRLFNENLKYICILNRFGKRYTLFYFNSLIVYTRGNNFEKIKIFS